MRMKYFLIIPLILLSVIFVSSLNVVSKPEYKLGETFIAEIQGEFYTTLTKGNIYFYKRHLPASLGNYKLLEVGGVHYVVVNIPTDKTPDNYSMVIRGATYYHQGGLRDDDFVTKFKINSMKVPFMTEPGIQETTGPYEITLINLLGNSINIDYTVLNKNTGSTLKTGSTSLGQSTKKILFIPTLSEGMEKIIFSTGTESYYVLSSIINIVNRCEEAGFICVDTRNDCHGNVIYIPCLNSPVCCQVEVGSSECSSGDIEFCITGQDGICSAGMRNCINGEWGNCVRNNNPVSEICGNQKDDDCDGYIDEGCSSGSECNSGESKFCITGQPGICSTGSNICVNGKWKGCERNNNPVGEICGNQKDDDCDGYIDEGCSSGSGSGSGSETECNTGESKFCITGQNGICSAGMRNCIDGEWGNCLRNNNPVGEICGNQKDDDCDGYIDEGCSSGSECNSGESKFCITGQPGICSTGTSICFNGNWMNCVRNNNPVSEICGNQKDDDCDGNIDEGCSSEEEDEGFFESLFGKKDGDEMLCENAGYLCLKKGISCEGIVELDYVCNDDREYCCKPDIYVSSENVCEANNHTCIKLGKPCDGKVIPSESCNDDTKYCCELDEVIEEGGFFSNLFDSKKEDETSGNYSDLLDSGDSEESVVKSVKTCQELNLRICPEGEICDGTLVNAKDNVCCRGICKVKEEDSTGKIIGWSIIAVIVLFITWFMKNKFNKTKKSPIKLYKK